MSVVKWMFDEPILNQSKSLVSDYELATLLHDMPYGIIGPSTYVPSNK